MAASAAQYAHCQPHLPVAFRGWAARPPEIHAPREFAARSAEIYLLDRELDRAVALEAELSRSGREAARASVGRSPRPADPEAPALPPFPIVAPPWSAPRVRELHRALFPTTGPGRGSSELRDRALTLTDAEGESTLECCPPGRIASELPALLGWVERSGPIYAPLVPATAILQSFYVLRPFPHGNRVVASTLARFYLRQAGLTNAHFVPLADEPGPGVGLWERLVLWSEATGSLTELLDLQADVVLRGYRSAVDRLLDPRRTGRRLDEIELRLLARARRAGGWFSARQAAGWVGGRSELTVLHRLNALVARGILESLGQTRAKRFRVRGPIPTESAWPPGSGRPDREGLARRRRPGPRPAAD